MGVACVLPAELACVSLAELVASMQAITRVIEAQDQLVEQAKVGGPPAPGSK